MSQGPMDSEQFLKRHIEGIQERCRAAGVTHIHEWTAKAKRVLVGTMLVRSVEFLGDELLDPVEKDAYLDLADIEWQVREAIKTGKVIALIPITLEDSK